MPNKILAESEMKEFGYNISQSAINDLPLEPQILHPEIEAPFVRSLYEENILRPPSKDSCKLNILVLGLDDGEGGQYSSKELNERASRYSTPRLKSRSDSINLLQWDLCAEKLELKFYSLYRGLNTPKKCLPDYWESNGKKKPMKLFLSKFFQLAGRKFFIPCAREIFQSRINRFGFENSDNLEINYLVEFYESGELEIDINGLVKELSFTTLRHPSVGFRLSSKDEFKDIREWAYPILNDVIFNDKDLKQALSDRMKMQGSAYERALIMANFIYNSQAWASKLFKNKPNALLDFLQVAESFVGRSFELSELETETSISQILSQQTTDSEDCLNQNPLSCPIILFGYSKDSFAASDGRDFVSKSIPLLDKLESVPELIPAVE